MLVTDLFTKILGEMVYPPILERGFSVKTRDNSLRRWYGDRYDFFWFRCDWDKDFGVIEGGVCVGFKSVAKFLKKCPPIRSDDIGGGITDTAQPVCAVSRLDNLTTPSFT